MFKQFRKTKAFAFIVGFALAASAGALAAFLVYQGLQGQANGNFSNSSSSQTALTVSNDGAAPALDPGGQTQVPLVITNGDSSTSHTLTQDATVTISSSPAQCSSYVHQAGFIGNPSGLTQALSQGTTYGPSESKHIYMLLNVDAGAPASCIGANWQAVFSAPTN